MKSFRVIAADITINKRGSYIKYPPSELWEIWSLTEIQRNRKDFVPPYRMVSFRYDKFY